MLPLVFLLPLVVAQGSASASTIYVTLWAYYDYNLQNYTVSVFARTDRGETMPGYGDGGISGFQFDILSDGTNTAAPVPFAPSGLNFGKVKTVFHLSSSDFALQKIPQKIDVGAGSGVSSRHRLGP